MLDYMAGLLRDGGAISFSVRNIIVEEAANISVIEFELGLGGKKLMGTDVIHWCDGLMVELRAYLYEKQG